MKMIMNDSDRIIVLDHGKKIAEGRPEEIRANEEMIQVYMGRRRDESRRIFWKAATRGPAGAAAIANYEPGEKSFPYSRLSACSRLANLPIVPQRGEQSSARSLLTYKINDIPMRLR